MMVIAVTPVCGNVGVVEVIKSNNFVLDIDFRLLNDRLSYIAKGGV